MAGAESCHVTRGREKTMHKLCMSTRYVSFPNGRGSRVAGRGFQVACRGF